MLSRRMYEKSNGEGTVMNQFRKRKTCKDLSETIILASSTCDVGALHRSSSIPRSPALLHEELRCMTCISKYCHSRPQPCPLCLREASAAYHIGRCSSVPYPTNVQWVETIRKQAILHARLALEGTRSQCTWTQAREKSSPRH